MSAGPERERFTDLVGNIAEAVVWPAPRQATRLEMADEHRPPLDDPADAMWLDPRDPRRRRLDDEI